MEMHRTNALRPRGSKHVRTADAGAYHPHIPGSPMLSTSWEAASVDACICFRLAPYK